MKRVLKSFIYFQVPVVLLLLLVTDCQYSFEGSCTFWTQVFYQIHGLKYLVSCHFLLTVSFTKYKLLILFKSNWSDFYLLHTVALLLYQCTRDLIPDHKGFSYDFFQKFLRVLNFTLRSKIWLNFSKVHLDIHFSCMWVLF